MKTTRAMRLLLLLTVFVINNPGFSQVSLGGTPTSLQHNKIHWNKDALVMPPVDVTKLLAEDEVNNQYKDTPYRFGHNFYLGKNLDNSGIWHELPNGDRIWIIGLESPGAYSLNLIFDIFYMPEGASMYVYNGDASEVIGAFGAHNNNDEEVFSTWPLSGDKIYIEYYEPAAVNGQGRLQIESLTHAYRDIHKIAQALGSSGACNNNVVCPVGAPWQNEINAVAMIVVNGSGICTGSLINNANNDGHPYFLTANHCTGGGVTAWTFRFNWQSSTCTGNTVGAFDTVSGSTLLASGPSSDFALLEINNGIPVPTAYNPFYEGWDATGANPTSQVCIHHPSGDIKKISFDNNPAGTATYGGATTWQIFNWEDGTTEPGSSGSPLYDQNHRVIGQLFGGQASCANNINDYFGKFSVTYPNICQWLDPGCVAGVLDGYDPNTPTVQLDAQLLSVSSPTGTLCGETFNADVTIRNAGVTTLTAVDIVWDVDGAASTTFNWTGSLISGSSILVTLGNGTALAGAHTFNVSLINPNGGLDENTANDGGSSAFTTVSGGSSLTLTLTTDCYASEVGWTIQDVNGVVLYSAATGSLTNEITTTTTLCLGIGCYDFIITDTYGDGMYGTQWGCNQNGDYNITDSQGNILVVMTAVNANYGLSATHNFCITGSIAGCTDLTACNFDPTATVDDGSCLFLDACGVCGGAGTFAGCTDLTACNFNAAANCDDGTCEFLSCACPSDFNGDGIVNVPDLLIFLQDYGCVSLTCVGDLNFDGTTDTADMLLFVVDFGQFCP